MAAKLADQERKTHPNPFGSIPLAGDGLANLQPTVNGNGHIDSD
jgi:hypothetical protein